MAVRDTPPDLGAPANYPADFAAILDPTVGATPTRDLAESNAPGSDQHQMLRVPVNTNSPTLTILTYILSLTVPKLLQIVGQICAFDGGTSLLNTLVRGELLNLGPRNLSSRN